jgi:3,4-dihydroxy 2-butanone 4-phosphate synthase/GTP cyclohydrolase II
LSGQYHTVRAEHERILMTFSPIPDVIAALKRGEMVILVDDEDRENEGDLVMAAQFADTNTDNFSNKHFNPESTCKSNRATWFGIVYLCWRGLAGI